eukprot:m.4274 g.4274  ORF g.4274 m.4274 type:complete len:362 (+) comp4448_c0_seq2:143-1228(+)
MENGETTSMPSTLLVNADTLGIFVVAIATIWHAVYRAVSLPLVRPTESTQDTPWSWKHALFVPLLASCALLVAYFFFDYLQFLYVIFNASIAAFCVFLTLQPLIRRCDRKPLPPTQAHVSAVFATLISFVVTGFIILRWILTASWVVTDFLAFCLCAFFVSALRLPSAKAASMLFVALMFYDIFWVFISPILFQKNVMVTVAVQEAPNPVNQLAHKLSYSVNLPSVALPVKIEIPSPIDQSAAMLGLGDIVVPALFIAYCKRVDEAMTRPRPAHQPGSLLHALRTFWRSLYCRSLLGFSLGLFLAIYMSELFDAPQPALIYLVPCVLLPPFALAVRMGRWNLFWSGALLHEGAAAVGEELV